MSYKELSYISAGGSKRSNDYNRKKSSSKRPSKPIAYKGDIKIPYKNQMLKQITNGKFGSKTYYDLARKKSSLQKDIEAIIDPVAEKEEKEEKEAEKAEQIVDNKEATVEQKDIIAKILLADKETEEEEEFRNAQQKPIIQTIKTIADIKKENLPINDAKKVAELENFVTKLSLEVEKLKNNQKQIIRAINRISKSGSKRL